MKKVGLAVLIIVAAVLITGFFFASRSQGSDADQIAKLIDRGRQGIEKKSSSDVMSCVSKSYTDSLGHDYGKLKSQMATALGPGVGYEVNLDPPVIETNGDAATASTSVSITGLTGGNREQVFAGAVKLRLVKEPCRRFFIFPAKEWKITRMDGIRQLPGMDL